MTNNKLMVGNLVSYNGNPIKVENIYGDYINYSPDIPYVQEETYIKQEELEPIPITPEILEKNGFEHNQKETELMQDIFGDNIMLFNFPLGNGFYIEWNSEKNVGRITDHCFIKFKYVHELQHVLKMCGIIREIII